MPRKYKGGRPLTGRPTGRKVTLYMLPLDEAKARKIGAGNLSAGVRQAVQAFGFYAASDSGCDVVKEKGK